MKGTNQCLAAEECFLKDFFECALAKIMNICCDDVYAISEGPKDVVSCLHMIWTFC